MISDAPKLSPLVLLGLAVVLCLSLYEQIVPGTSNWVALIAGSGGIMFTFLWLVALVDFMIKSVAFAHSLWTISRPDVRITEANAEIARQVAKMSAMQMSHHLQVLNALQMPMRLQPDDMIDVAGRQVHASSLLEYVSKMDDKGNMPKERDYTREPERSDVRHLADVIGKSYSVEAANNQHSVITTKPLLHKFIDEVVR